MERTLEQLSADQLVQIQKYNEAMLCGKLEDARKAETALETIEKDYSKQKAKEVFDALKSGETPFLNAIRKHDYPVIAHRDVKDKDTKLSTRIDTEKTRQIDLLRFEEYAKEAYAADPKWAYILQRFNQLMCMRCAKELGLSVSVCDSYFVAEKAKEIKLGKTPLSNPEVIKALQAVVNAIIGETYVVTEADMYYILFTFTKKGKAALSIASANHTAMRNLIGDMLHRIVTEKAYGLEFKVAPVKADKPAVTENVTETKQDQAA